MPERRILMGVIGRPHGVQGFAHVTSYADDLTAHGPLSDPEGRRFVLRWRGDGVAEIAELVAGAEVRITDRAAVEKLTNTRLYVDRAQLSELSEDEFYFADLIGLAAFDEDGARLGTVIAVHDYGAGTSLEIAPQNAPPLLVPFTRSCVPAVDIGGGMVLLKPPRETDAIPKPIAAGSPAPAVSADGRVGPGHDGSDCS